MKPAVLDTNTLASGIVGLLKPASTPGTILRAWAAGAFPLVVSEHILSELTRTLNKPYFTQRISSAGVARWVASLRAAATLAEISIPVHGVAGDPADDLILATAVSARAGYLVTGDAELQKLGTYQGVEIVSPRQFLDLLQRDQTRGGRGSAFAPSR